MNQHKDKFVALLEELFQLNQPELDFGLYRILHARSAQIKSFVQNELKDEIDKVFASQTQASAHDLLKAARLKVEQTLGEYALDANGDLKQELKGTPIGKDYELARKQAQEGGGPLADDAQVYDHLYRFFSRYYDKGDFMSKRYFVSENDTRAAPYAIPYDGREVMLHWANKDQYYIKSSEYLANYTVDLAAAKKLVEQDTQGGLDFAAPDQSLKVHFRLAEATEGEHNNVKEDQERFFLIHSPEPVKLEANSHGEQELVIHFQYRPDPEKSGQGGTWQQKRLAEAEMLIKEKLAASPEAKPFADALFTLAPTEKQATRSLLAKYLGQYTSRNTMDYFIHKNLGGFLRRELDFYIKNEIMRLDDIEAADAPRVETYLKKVQSLRKIARRIIDFLAQIEDFQKKLWLKKKFVVETNYCITLDRIPKALYKEIAANEAQREEWVKLFAIDEIKCDKDGYSNPLTDGFLLKNQYLLIDTRLYDESLKEKLIGNISDLDNKCDGTLIQSDNFQAINLIAERIKSQVDCIYLDPPYNTGKDGFPYKDEYKTSSWLSMINDRISISARTMKPTAGIFVSCDENEQTRLSLTLESIFGNKNSVANFIWKTDGNFDNQAKVKIAHEHILLYAQQESSFAHPPVIEPGLSKDSKVFNDQIQNTIVKNGPKNPVGEIAIPAGFPCLFESGTIPAMRTGRSKWPKFNEDITVDSFKTTNSVIASSGWSSKAQCEEFISNNFQSIKDSKNQLTRFALSQTGAIESIKDRATDGGYVTSIIHSVGTTQSTSAFLENAGLEYPFFPKPVGLVQYLISMVKNWKMVLDFFGGSGTTAHAVISSIREGTSGISKPDDNNQKKYILIEQAAYFNTVLKPRIEKAVHASEWEDGKPVSRDGISHCFKYLRLESYEDTLNNLVLLKDATVDAENAKNSDFTRDYLRVGRES